MDMFCIDEKYFSGVCVCKRVMLNMIEFVWVSLCLQCGLVFLALG